MLFISFANSFILFLFFAFALQPCSPIVAVFTMHKMYSQKFNVDFVCLLFVRSIGGVLIVVTGASVVFRNFSIVDGISFEHNADGNHED